MEKTELLERAWQLFQKFAIVEHPRKGTKECVMTKYQFMEAMENEDRFNEVMNLEY